jgi:hypothetical protein
MAPLSRVEGKTPSAFSCEFRDPGSFAELLLFLEKDLCKEYVCLEVQAGKGIQVR